MDYIFINNKNFPSEIIDRYKSEKDSPVVDDLKNDGYQIIRDDFLASDPIEKASGDKLKRSFIRHDSEKLAQKIFELL